MISLAEFELNDVGKKGKTKQTSRMIFLWFKTSEVA